MVKWIADNTGRFPQRPYYEIWELDHQCETIIQDFLISKYGNVRYPISTDDLTILIERDADDLNLYADLSSEGADVEGLTEFFPDRKPRVLIARELSEQAWRENRLRSTLTHEYGHVKIHDSLWARGQLGLFSDNSKQNPICKREYILNANTIDWLEWQAGYVSGAFLMPITSLRAIVQEVYKATALTVLATFSSQVGKEIIHEVMIRFQVSEEAAKVRLSKLGYLSEQQLSLPVPFGLKK